MEFTLENAGVTGLAALKELLANDQFHHATYRNQGTLWEGLHIYRKSDGGRGFEHVTIIPGRVGREFCGGTRETNRSILDEAYRLIGGQRLHLGAYGEG
jgi:hypothetical protein